MINGKLLSQGIISGANNIINQKVKVDELNVFPVPDGDTGTNMSMTIKAAKLALESLDENADISKVADTCASALLRGARGNSGVILSLLFRGFSKGLKDKEEANANDIATALQIGVENAYKAVMNPTEGTILTVARLCAEKAVEVSMQTNDPILVFEEATNAASKALEETPNILPVLKKAGVVDAGGKGLLVILEGMIQVFKYGETIELLEKTHEPKQEIKTTFAEYDTEITFFYCTEFIVQKKKDANDSLKLRAYLETIGDCVVVVDDDEIIKVHVHTNDPGNALQEGLKFGTLMNIKIENMNEQYHAKQAQDKKVSENQNYVSVDEDVEYGFVAVAAGAGVQDLFRDLGANAVVSGGQTMNPSTEDILAAIHSVGAKNVFVLPNNKNIIMAAEQAVKLADRNVCVLQTRTIPQGLSAMMSFNPDADVSENKTVMTQAFDRVQTGQITFAARNSDFDGHKIKQGEILAIDNGKLSFVDKDVTKALNKLVKSLTKKSDGNFITIMYGSDVTQEQAESAVLHLKNKYSNYDVNLINGGQPVYYYIVSVE